jgi:hypothetical protein
MLNKKIGLMALFASLAATGLVAGTLTNYTTGDVLLCFRNGQTRNLVVDLGPNTIFTSGTPNQRIPLTQYSAGQITAAFGDAGGLNWSAFAWLDDGTLFVTKKRTGLNTQSATPNAANAGLQSSAAQNMAPIPVGASYQYYNLAPNSTQTAVNEPQSDTGYPSQTGRSYYSALLGGGQFSNFGGTLPSGDPEVATPGNFATSGTVVRSDLYQIPPGVGKANVTYLGYFEIAANGTMTFVAKPSTVPAINSISRVGNDSIITYTTGLYGTYTLRGTNVLSGFQTNWPAITTLASGDNSIHTVTNTTTQAIQFYTITAQ